MFIALRDGELPSGKRWSGFFRPPIRLMTIPVRPGRATPLTIYRCHLSVPAPRLRAGGQPRQALEIRFIPTITGWVRSEDIAAVDQQFVTEWLTLADKNLGAFIKEPVSVHEGGQYYFTARPGTILPFRNRQPGFLTLLCPCVKAMAAHRFARSDFRKMSLSPCHGK